MNDELLLETIKYWVSIKRPKIWQKTNSGWELKDSPDLKSNKKWIVDDRNSEAKKTYFDDPDNVILQKFEQFNETWYIIDPMKMNTPEELRVKPSITFDIEKAKGKYLKVRDNLKDDFDLDIFVDFCEEYDAPYVCEDNSWVYAEPFYENEVYVEKTPLNKNISINEVKNDHIIKNQQILENDSEWRLPTPSELEKLRNSKIQPFLHGKFWTNDTIEKEGLAFVYDCEFDEDGYVSMKETHNIRFVKSIGDSLLIDMINTYSGDYEDALLRVSEANKCQ